MGKKSKSKNKKTKISQKPFVSVCTPTFNRRPFIPNMIECFNNQTYPKDKIEWIIIDDGFDKIEDLVINHQNVKYFKYDKKMSLGKKRNLMHEKSKGDIIVYMDDDDYYPPTRIEHAVNKLLSSKNLIAGSSEIYIYFKHILQMWRFGPYGPNHATAGTFAFKKELLNITRYNESKCLAEEKEFLKNYTIPMIQLDPRHTILVFSHTQNTFDKKKLIENGENQVSKISDKTVDYFVKEPNVKDWFLNKINIELDKYDNGKPIHKPDVLQQLISIEEERRKMAENNNGNIVIKEPGKEPVSINPQELSNMLNQLKEQLYAAQQIINNKDKLINQLTNQLNEKDNKIDELNNTIGSWKQTYPDGNEKNLTGMDIINIIINMQNEIDTLKNKKD